MGHCVLYISDKNMYFVKTMKYDAEFCNNVIMWWERRGIMSTEIYHIHTHTTELLSLWSEKK